MIPSADKETPAVQPVFLHVEKISEKLPENA